MVCALIIIIIYIQNNAQKIFPNCKHFNIKIFILVVIVAFFVNESFESMGRSLALTAARHALFVCLCGYAAPFVICFVEHVERVTGVVTQALQSAASQYFAIASDKVFVWQYNGDPLGSAHFVYLLNEIGKAFVCVSYYFLLLL